MKRLLPILLAALALSAPAGAERICADAVYASEVCPWFGEAEDGFAAPRVAMRWSSDGYRPGSKVGRWNDGIYVIVSLPRAQPSGVATLLLDIGYEPPFMRARPLTPVAVDVRLGDEQWRADAPQPLPPAPDAHPWLRSVEGSAYRFTFGPDLVAAMLAASDDAPRTYRDLLLVDEPTGVLRFEILFRDANGGIVSSSDIVQVDSGRCEAYCRPLLSPAGFAEAYETWRFPAGAAALPAAREHR